jgi:phosphoribosyl-ATP pyrophosphohydrolase
MTIIELNHTFQIDRPVMHLANSCPHAAFRLLCGEVEEARAEFEALQSGENTREAAAYELADIVLFCFTTMHALGYEPQDVNEIIRSKVGRNALKYPSANFQDGEYSEKLQEHKAYWRQIKGDEQFFAEAV